MPEQDKKPNLRLVPEPQEPEKAPQVQETQDTLPIAELEDMTISFEPRHPERRS